MAPMPELTAPWRRGDQRLLPKNCASAANRKALSRGRKRDDSTETRCGVCTNCCGSLLSDNALDAPDRTDSLWRSRAATILELHQIRGYRRSAHYTYSLDSPQPAAAGVVLWRDSLISGR